MDGLVVLSGCSGGGKSTILDALAACGFPVVPEPGRRVVAEQEPAGGTALPWIDLAAFARRALTVALEDRASALPKHKPVFFDRSAIDAAAALQHVTGEPALDAFRHAHRYDRQVFLVPPWPEIYVSDAGRRHDLSAAVAEYDRLSEAYAALGYAVTVVPRRPVNERVAMILRSLGLKASG